MKKRFEVLSHASLSQIQMWLNQKQTTKGNVAVESPMFWDFDAKLYVIIISYND